LQASAEDFMGSGFWAVGLGDAAAGPKQVLVRISALAALMIAAVLTAAPARAQTYNPDYPVCLQTYGRAGGYIDCRYVSLAQCGLSASGRAAQCIVNPYFAGAEVPVGPHHRRYRHVY
jgi:hypothetical protein